MLRGPLPPSALLRRYSEAGAYTDCYLVDLAGAASFADYVEAFYCSTGFRPERALLGLMGMGADDEDARRLARGEADRFAAWTVEARGENQLLLCDYKKATRSWLMLLPTDYGARLYFGSAVVLSGRTGTRLVVGRILFNSLLWFHAFYSRVLLRSAERGLRKPPERVRP